MAGAGGLAGFAGAALAQPADPRARVAVDTSPGGGASVEPFWGARQGGVLTPRQTHTCFVTFDVAANATRPALAGLMRRWTEAAGRLTQGEPTESDSDVALGLAPARLTVTFGFGPSLFGGGGAPDRFGFARLRPAALVDMPAFNGDQLEPQRTGGDLSVQACADDPQIAFHAVRELAQIGYGVAQIRSLQTGFCGNDPAGQTARNLMGFKDGTMNPGPGPNTVDDAEAVVWAGDEGPAWMRGGTYVVARRIRMALEHWDRSPVDYQEQVFGRRKRSGAPLGETHEFDALDLAATDKDGNDVIPDDAHARLAAAISNDGARIFRRAYSYNDGVNMVAERWPPWHQGIEFDAGLLFICYSRDPRHGFIRIFDRMSKLDALNQFTTHVGSGLFACPPGAERGGYIGQALVEA